MGCKCLIVSVIRRRGDVQMSFCVWINEAKSYVVSNPYGHTLHNFTFFIRLPLFSIF